MTSDFGNPLRKFKLVFLGEQSGKCVELGLRCVLFYMVVDVKYSFKTILSSVCTVPVDIKVLTSLLCERHYASLVPVVEAEFPLGSTY